MSHVQSWMADQNVMLVTLHVTMFIGHKQCSCYHTLRGKGKHNTI